MNRILIVAESIKSGLRKVDWLSPLFARLVLGDVFLESGWGKIHNLPKVVEYFSSLQIPAPEFQAHLVAYTELVGGALILFGLFTRLISIPLLFTMVVAILTAKREDLKEFTDLFGFSEFLYILLFFWLIIDGAGKASLDFLLFRNRK